MAASLPPGWTQHTSLAGHVYFHNTHTFESTYRHPGKPRRRERPLHKQPIPSPSNDEEEWLRVTTTYGNVFYANRASGVSTWNVPDEIREQVQTLEREERATRKRERKERREAEATAKQQQQERLRQEEQEKRKQEDEVRKARAEGLKQAQREQEQRIKALREIGKRKRGEEVDEEEEQSEEEGGVDAMDLLNADVPDNEAQGTNKRFKVDQPDDAAEEEDEDAAWQREMAAEMAAEQEQDDPLPPTAQPQAISAPSLVIPPPPPGGYTGPPPGFPAQYSVPPPALAPPPALSPEEAKALFLSMLASLNGTPAEINPMAPWDRELPKFIQRPEYGALSVLRERQDAFNEFCKARIREKRAARTSGAAPAEIEKKEEEPSFASSAADTLTAYRALLERSVTSTRTRWEEFKKQHRRERAFFAYARSDAEREKEFRRYLRELGERKRAAADEAANDFLALLSEKLGDRVKLQREASKEEVNATWSKAKREPGLDSDKRYDAVGSSSLRAELFEKWAKGERKGSFPTTCAATASAPAPAAAESKQSAAERKARDAATALRERQEQVRRQQAKVQSENRRALGAATHEESVVAFAQLLLDHITNPLTTFDDASAKLGNDARWSSTLPAGEKHALFAQHIGKLDAQKREALFRLFEKHAASLDVRASTAVPLVEDDEAMERAALNEWVREECRRSRCDLRDLFESWMEDRTRKAKAEFFEMLKESSFVAFWGNLRKERARKEAAGEDADGIDKDAEADGEEAAAGDDGSLLRMAAAIDLDEIHSVLRHDARYSAFKHVPEQREAWIREHLEHLAGMKKTVFQRDA